MVVHYANTKMIGKRKSLDAFLSEIYVLHHFEVPSEMDFLLVLTILSPSKVTQKHDQVKKFYLIPLTFIDLHCHDPNKTLKG